MITLIKYRKMKWGSVTKEFKVYLQKSPYTKPKLLPFSDNKGHNKGHDKGHHNVCNKGSDATTGNFKKMSQLLNKFLKCHGVQRLHQIYTPLHG